MRQLVTTLRRSPASVLGILVALIATAAMVTIVAAFIGTGATMKAPVHRLAAASAVVVGDQHVRFTTGHGDNKDTTALSLATYRRVSTDLVGRLEGVPGVQHAVADISVAVAVRSGDASAEVSGHGWQSAALTPFRLSTGHEPGSASDVVLGAGVARALHLGIGDQVRLSGRDLSAFTVIGIAAAPPGNPAGASTVFFTDDEARQLYGHPGQADFIAVLADPHAAPGLPDRIRAAAGSAATVFTGSKRGYAEDVDASGDKDNLSSFALGAGIPVVMVTLFVVAGAVGLSVAGRRRHFALLRAVGATPGQIRRRIAGELAVLGIAGGLIGYPVGTLMAGLAIDGMARHGMVPAHTAPWTALWVVPIACGAGLVIAQLAGFVAGWRAGRADPVLALREATTDRRRPNPLRLVLGTAALGGAITLAIVTFHQSANPVDELNLALVTLLSFVAAVGLLAPVLVMLAELLIRGPAQALGGPGARLALADIRRRPLRIASAVVAVALSVGFLGTVYLVNVTMVHAGVVQARDRLVADSVVGAPGGLASQALPAIADAPGVHAAIGVTPTTVYLPFDGGDIFSAAALTRGDIAKVLDLHVVAGDLRQIGPGQIAVSQLVAGKSKVGSTIRAYLADGTTYQARIVAIFGHGLGFGDAVIPADAAGGGHLGVGTMGQVLVSGALADKDVHRLGARFPGLQVQDRSVANAEAKRLAEQDQYLNTMIVLLMTILASVTLVNTLATATLERRESLHLLDRVGATWRQLMAMAGWQTLTVSAIGTVCGVGSGAAALIAVTKALTGDWRPYVPVGPAVGMSVGVVVLAAIAILGPTARILRPASGATAGPARRS